MNQELLCSVYSDSLSLSGNSVYITEFNVFHMKEEIITNLKHSNLFQSKKLKTSYSVDGKYKKEHGKVFKLDKTGQTETVHLQDNVSLKGYWITEKELNTAWSDDSNVKLDHKSFKKEEEGMIFFTKEILVYVLSNTIIVKFHNPTISLVSEYTNLILRQLYKNYPFIMTLEEEQKVRKYEIIKVIKELETLSKATYCLSKSNERSVLIKNYFYTIPCVRFNLNKEVFLIDTYDHIVKIDSTEEEDYTYIDEGFVYPDYKFVQIETLDFHYKMEKTDALVYYNENRQYEIYTHPMNIYIEDGINRTSGLNMKYNSSNLMTKEKILEIRNVLCQFEIRRIVNHFYSDFNIDYLKPLTDYIKLNQKMFEMELDKKGVWLKDFVMKLLNITYDEKRPIIFKLDSETFSDTKITDYYVSLDSELEKEKVNIDIFHDYHVNKEKSDFYNLSIKFLDKLKLYSKEVQKKVHVSGSITNAWMKCWEMINVFDLVPKDHSKEFTIFCNAEFPGAFILALNHYIKTETVNKEYEWYANSLWPDNHKNKEIFKDHFKLYEKYQDKWLMTPENTGDVTNLKMVKIIEDRLSEKVDLYTSDIGTGVEENQETNETVYNLGQVICGLKTLKNGGTMVCKMFSFFKPFNMSLLKLLTKLFSEFYLTKPMSSRPANSEIYIIGKGYTKNQDVIDVLVEYLIHWKEDSIYEFIEPITEDFYLKMVYILYYVYERQIYFLKKNMCFVKALYDKKINKFFQIFKNNLLKEQVSELDKRQEVVDEWKEKFPIPFLEKRYDL